MRTALYGIKCMKVLEEKLLGLAFVGMWKIARNLLEG
jgi:hypothetical protein